MPLNTTIQTAAKAQCDTVSEPVIRISHLHKSFGSNKVLADFNLELNSGENIVVLGKSGSGKSVLIKCIIGLIKPDSGAIAVFGEEVTALSGDRLDKIRMQMGFLFQGNALYDSMTVRENLEFPLRRHSVKLKKQEADELVLGALGDVGLEHTVDMMPAELSGGMRKRIALARTLILKPRIILYDEPTTGLDPITGKEIIQLMIDIQEKYKASSLIISHDMNCVRTAADRVIMLIDGKCYAEGNYETLSASNDPKIKNFFE